MLKDEVASVIQDILCENPVRDGLQTLQSIRGIGKNQICLHPANVKELKDIVPYDIDIFKGEL